MQQERVLKKELRDARTAPGSPPLGLQSLFSKQWIAKVLYSAVFYIILK
jgi:hypothetical protein